ncbi:MAG: hypothetical protein IPL65_06780 [Lewinellaceae bacterium]|nr:hypothetical protein [Lewinellaceae bacterium]
MSAIKVQVFDRFPSATRFILQATQAALFASIKHMQQFFLRVSTILRPCLLLLGLLWGPGLLVAQQPLSNLRTRFLPANTSSQDLDTLTIALPLLEVRDSSNGQLLDSALFQVYNRRLLIDTAALHNMYPGLKTIQTQYRVFPVDLAGSLSRLDTVLIRKASRDNAIEFDYTPYQPATPLLGGTGLNSSGVYTRGLSFGNSQNLVFNSNLNLQLDGKLGNDLNIRAAISDNSIPLQPDGSTRQLQEFDRVYIQLNRKYTTLTAGDYDLTKPQQNYFSNYFKRLQGAQVETQIFPQLKNREKMRADTLALRTAAGVSRGKFARQIIAGQEGNQGPYRLQGAEGERFIIVLAGTEKVYIDGILLRRGLIDDYVIDYNLGEITFTQRKLITKDSRIIVEFEYAVQAYLRSTAAANLEWKMEKQRVYFNLYSEQDSRNSGGAQDLSAEERQALAQAGDQLQQAYASGIDTLSGAFDPPGYNTNSGHPGLRRFAQHSCVFYQS